MLAESLNRHRGRYRDSWARRMGVCIAGVVACLLAGAGSAQDWDVPPRAVPPPKAASEQLSEHLASLPTPDAAAAGMAVPADRAGWIALARMIDQQWIEQTDALAATLPVSVAEDRIAGVPVHRLTPAQPDPRFANMVYLDLHGGAYVFGRGSGALREALLVADRVGVEVVAVDYRMPPIAEPFPAALDDALTVYLELVAEYGSENIAVGGTSAGGGLTLALVHRLQALELPLPAALYVGTPWADLTKTGDTQFTNEGIDNILVTWDGTLGAAAALYVGVNDWRDPLLSPVYGDFTEFPPTMLVSGTRDLFLSDVVRVHRALRAANVDADLHVYEGLAHAEYYILENSPESSDTYRELKAFLLNHLTGDEPEAQP